MTLISGALQRLREDYAAAGQAALYQELEGLLTGSGRGGSLAEIVQRLCLSEGAVRWRPIGLRKRFGKVLRRSSWTPFPARRMSMLS